MSSHRSKEGSGLGVQGQGKNRNIFDHRPYMKDSRPNFETQNPVSRGDRLRRKNCTYSIFQQGPSIKVVPMSSVSLHVEKVTSLFRLKKRDPVSPPHPSPPTHYPYPQ